MLTVTRDSVPPRCVTCPPGLTSRMRRLQPSVCRLGSLLLLLGAWEHAGMGTALTLSHPSVIAAALYEVAQSGELLQVCRDTLGALGVAAACALMIGVPLGALMGRLRPAGWMLEPYLRAWHAAPSVALGPLLALLLVPRSQAPVVAAFLCALSPVALSTCEGVRNTAPALLDVAQSFHSTRWRVWRDVLAPGALPAIAAGTRQALARALAAIVIVEAYTGGAGLGAMVVRSMNSAQPDRAFAALLVLVLLGAGLKALVRSLEHRIAHWSRA
jgi:ABC-type nitrate/sulfonate/bicarbonate transport system permease component